MKIGNFFSSFKITASGLNTQKRQLDITAENIANSSTTRTDKGTPYKRKVLLKKLNSSAPLFTGMLNRARVSVRTTNPNHISSSTKGANSSVIEEFNMETEMVERAQFKKIYDPAHPDADLEGFVEYPDINVINEMLDLITASRAYEANITVMNAAKNMAKKSLEI